MAVGDDPHAKAPRRKRLSLGKGTLVSLAVPVLLGATTEIWHLVLEHVRATGARILTLLPNFANSVSAPFGDFHRTHPSVRAERIALADLD